MTDSVFLNENFLVNSPNVTYTDSGEILSNYVYRNTIVSGTRVSITEQNFTFKTNVNVPKLGVMLVGWGGNNGTTVTGGILANRLGVEWRTKEGKQVSNYFGSLTQASTVKLGINERGESVYIPFNKLLPMVHPNDFVLGGWDINNSRLGDAMVNAKVFDVDLQNKLFDEMNKFQPLPSIYQEDFIAGNQADRANNILTGTKQEMMDTIRSNIRDFKATNGLDKVIVLWTANTERFCEVIEGVHDTSENILAAIQRGESEVSPSTLFAVATILEGSSFINGSPQNTLVPGVVQLAEQHQVFIGGDDFKSGQTKMKSVLVDFLVSAGIKPVSIVSYNHLGNNDGKNLSSPQQFRSKEISKSNVVDDMVASNSLLYPEEGEGESRKRQTPDHCVVIKYVPYVGDSKRAMDEYTSEIFMGGRNTIVMHNTCEDSLLAAPLIFDLVILCELCERIRIKKHSPLPLSAVVASSASSSEDDSVSSSSSSSSSSSELSRGDDDGFERFHSVLSLLSYLLKAPMVPPGTPVVNALAAQRQSLINVFRACVGLPPDDYMQLEHKIPSLIEARRSLP